MNENKQVKGFHIRLKLKGKGIVNYDSNRQKYLHNKTLLKTEWNDNESYAKKCFTENYTKYKIKISSDCLLYGMYNGVYKNPNLVHDESLLYLHLASKRALVRGELLASKSTTYKKHHALRIDDAVQTNDANSYLDTFSKAGERTANSYYLRERIGDIEYASGGYINLKEMQFLSGDAIYDRLMFNPDYFDYFKDCLKATLPTFNSNLGYYKMLESTDMSGEYGVLLSSNDCELLVKDTLTRILQLYVGRKDGYARTESLDIKPVYDAIDDTFDDENGWVSVDKNFIDSLKFSMFCYYEETDKAQSEAYRKKFEEIKAELKATKEETSKKTKKDKKQNNSEDNE